MQNIISSYFNDFLKLESAGGILLFASAILAIIAANTGLSVYYDMFLSTPVEVRVGALEIAKPLLLWINDGLMAIFFFLVGLELKRELMEGELKDRRNILLPAAGAIGGMIVPALIYLYFNGDDPVASAGWAIPAATDIAFALGVLTLLGSKVPISLKIFLTSLAIFDDIGAIVIIAVFYTENISFTAIVVIIVSLLILFWLNKSNVVSFSPYMIIGIIMWIATLKSGVHATLAGVFLAVFIPMRSKVDQHYSPVKTLEHDLHTIVAFFVLPLFAFANAGISIEGIGSEQILHPVSIGSALGLFLGKQIGVFLFCFVLVKMHLATLPKEMSWAGLYGVAVLSGIGFTMSLFIGSLAFEETGVNLLFDERLGIIIGSFASGILGYLVLYFGLRKSN